MRSIQSFNASYSSPFYFRIKSINAFKYILKNCFAEDVLGLFKTIVCLTIDISNSK